ncbi:MliC family protein [Porticoccaceae bacterium LTM1]|nr:MliC family protein [Porticoccaceae bacterium LTM1]
MRIWQLIFVVMLLGCQDNIEHTESPDAAPALCTEAWFISVEQKVTTGDGAGHGPDIGSEEWKSVVEFKLKVRGNPDVPARNSESWCRYIDNLLATKGESDTTVDTKNPVTFNPSFDCSTVSPGSIPALICESPTLSGLDRKLAEVYAAALKIAVNEQPPTLKAEQRGWIKGRDDCWKSEDKLQCVETLYLRRIAELQARYRLVSFKGPVRYTCEGNPANEVVVTFYDTEPATLIAERGDSVSVMFQQPSASGTKYQGRNEMFWEHQEEATIVWGYDAPEMSCQKAN